MCCPVGGVSMSVPAGLRGPVSIRNRSRSALGSHNETHAGSLRERLKRKRSLFSSASSVSRHAPPKQSQMTPRTVRGPGYTGWCLACPEAAVASTGGRSRTPPGGSRCARRTAHSTLQQAIVSLASRRLSGRFPLHAVRRSQAARHQCALLRRMEQGDPRSRRRTVPREGPLEHVVRR